MGTGAAMAMEESVSDGMGMSHGMDMMDGMGMAPTLALSGNAEMGVVGNKDDEARLHTDIDVTFKATGTMDSGVTWSADVDLDEVQDNTNMVAGPPAQTVDAATGDDDDDGGVTIKISQPEGFGTLTMGDAPGGIAWAVSDARGAGPGSIRDNHEHGASSGNDGLDAKHDNQILLWDRAIGSGFSLAASVEIDDDKDGKPDTATFDPILGVGGKFSMGMGVGTLGLGAGFQMGSFAHTFTEGLTGQQRADNVKAAADAKKLATGKKLWFVEGKPANGGKAIPDKGREVDATAFGGSVSLDFGNGGDGIKLIADGGIMEADGGYTMGTGDAAKTHTFDMEAMHVGVGLGYTVGAISLGVNAGTKVTEESRDEDSGSATTGLVKREKTVNGIGFSAAYDLGGGAAIQFGAGSQETEHDWTFQDAKDGTTAAIRSGGGLKGYDQSSDTNSWSLGVKFSF